MCLVSCWDLVVISGVWAPHVLDLSRFNFLLQSLQDWPETEQVMHTAFFYKMANDFAFDYVFWYLLVFVNSVINPRLGAGALWRVSRNFGCWPRTWIRNFGSATVGYWSSKARHTPAETDPMQFWCFDGLICICCICCSQILPDLRKLYGFMHGFYPPDGTETVSTPLQSS